jgi:integral membrane protein
MNAKDETAHTRHRSTGHVMERRFHRLGRIEGVSLLALVLVAMPLKYLAGQPLAVTVVGSVHGLLWVVYMLMLAQVWGRRTWPFSTVVLAGVASVLPFGPWWFERRVSGSAAGS